MRAKEFIFEADSYSPPTLNVGDRILKGKFKNSPAEIKGFTRDKHNQPVLKTDRGEVQLFKPRVTKLMDKDVAEGEAQNINNSLDKVFKENNIQFDSRGERSCTIGRMEFVFWGDHFFFFPNGRNATHYSVYQVHKRHANRVGEINYNKEIEEKLPNFTVPWFRQWAIEKMSDRIVYENIRQYVYNWAKTQVEKQAVAEGRDSGYKEIEFVCANPEFSDATDPDLQKQMYAGLKQIPGVIPLFQDQSDYSEGQYSLTAIYKDRAVRGQILKLAKQLGVRIDLEQPVTDDYVDRAIRGEHEGQQGVSEGGPETTWSDDTDTITLQDILELTKHIKQINLPINDNLKSKLLHWEGNPEEIERVNQVTVSNQFPILIMVDKQGQIEWILDGNHRLHKAIQSQAKTIPAKLIKPSDLNDKAKKIFNIKEQGVAEGLSIDVPNEQWLQDKIDYAKSKGRDEWGAPFFGTTTAYVRPNPQVSVVRLELLKGMRNEQNNVRKTDLEWLMAHMEKTGKLPLTNQGEEYAPFVMVAYNGEAWVSEGNHRIMAAYRLGWKKMPIEIRYFDGGERVQDGIMYPGKIGLGQPAAKSGVAEGASNNLQTIIKSFVDNPLNPKFVNQFVKQGVAEGSQEINWVKPNFDFEWHEVEEQSRMKQVPVDVRQYYQKHFPNKDAWLKAVQNGKAVVVPPDHAYEIRNAPFDKASLQKVLAPTGHEGPIGPAKEKRVNDLFDKGQVEMPIILKTSQGLWLIGGKTRLGTANYVKGLPAKVWLISGEQGVAENFADGRGPGRPGDSQRHGIPKHATRAELEKASHAKGRKGQLARWQLNMRRGKKK